MKRATISDVASDAGVSIGTVSHVLNGTKFVSSGVRTKVLASVARLEYRPSVVASSLRRQTSHVIGLVLPLQPQDDSSTFFTAVAQGVDSVLSPRGFQSILSNTSESASRERDQLELLHGRFTDLLDGLIFAPTATDHATDVGAPRPPAVPTVYVDRFPVADSEAVDYVGTDNYKATTDGLRLLMRGGVRDIVCVSSPMDVSSMLDRRRAFTDVVGPVVDDPEKRIIVTDSSFRGGLSAGHQLLERFPEAEGVFITNPTVAMGVIAALQGSARATNLPRLLIYDKRDWLDLVSGQIISVSQPAFEMGRVAGEVLLEKLDGDSTGPVKRIVDSQLAII